MIQANELRIGNWFSQFGYYHQVGWETIKDLEKKPQGQLWCKPIPLTPEILEKCGFEKEYESQWTIKYTLLTDSRFGYDWNKTFEWRMRYLGEHFSRIQHLHQLQNLYFALTGEELIFKPNSK